MIHMRRQFMTVFSALAILALAGCLETTGGTKQTVGTGAGAVLGGLAGSQVGGGSGRLWATGAGALAGALLGSEVGKSLDKADMAYARQANVRAHRAPLGETISWNNPESGNSGTVTPVRDGYSTAGRYCREYQQEIYVGGQKEAGYGTACQQPDGSWEIVK
jgi:surface antigen